MIKKLCDDCYMDALSPTKTCDPWAVYTAKSIQKRIAVQFNLMKSKTK